MRLVVAIVPSSKLAEVGAVLESNNIGDAEAILDVGYSASGNAPATHFAFCAPILDAIADAIAATGVSIATFNETGVVESSNIPGADLETNAPVIIALLGLKKVGSNGD